jgi:hypothetical protein
MPSKRKGNRRGAGVANNEPLGNDASRKRNFHIILCLPLSREDIEEVEERYGNSVMNQNRVDNGKPDDENAPNPIMDPTQLDYTDLQPMNDNKLGNSQVFNTR